METIRSVQNETVKNLIKLQEKEAREREEKVLIEGANLISELPTYVEVFSFFCTEEAYGKYRTLIEGRAVKTILIDEKVSRKLSRVKEPQGIFALVSTHFQVPEQKGFTVILDGISDPGNFGTIARTCVALGITELYTLGGVDRWNEKVIRASLGSLFKLNIHLTDAQTLEKQMHGFTVYGLDMGGQDLFLEKISRENTAIALGSEATGLSQSVKGICKRLISLPMRGSMESLNAPVALGATLYHIFYA